MKVSGTRWTWVQAAAEGDEDATQSFVLKYRPAVLAFLRQRGFTAEAEDLTQEVFLRLFRDGVLTKADPARGRLRNLLLAVTKNVLGKFVAHATAQKRGGGAVQALGEREVAAAQEDEGFDREWLLHLLERALVRLEREHPNYHEALSRYLLEGAPQGEVAQAMALSRANVKNLVHRGKRKLLGYLHEEVWAYASSQQDYATELQELSRLFPAEGRAGTRSC